MILAVWSVLFALAGIGVGAYVNSQQNKSAKNLEESKAVLTTQRSIENEVMLAKKDMQDIQFQVGETKKEVNYTLQLIENNLTELYIKLQAEEVNFLIEQIYKQPNLMHQLYDRFLVLRLTDEHFQKLVTFIFEQGKLQSDNEAVNSVFSIILNQFPKKWLEDNRLKESFISMNSWVKIIGQYNFEGLKPLVDNLCDYMLDKAPDKVDFKVGSAYLEQSYKLYKGIVTKRVIPPEVRDSLPDKRLTLYFYNKLSRKELRFDMYDVLRQYSCGIHFWKLLEAEYKSDQTNTLKQTELLNLCKDVYMGHPDNV
ncbi:hypothetical protein [Pontibacter saemangeumensis]|uniref:hypothetical protein n=1 Tax=Pontibacter saemangeumensis TaxID=1084525 RepID=UPI0031E6BDDF